MTIGALDRGGWTHVGYELLGGEKASAVARRARVNSAAAVRGARTGGRRAVARRPADDGTGENGSAFAPVILDAARPCGHAACTWLSGG
jgi:hypothetical protein